MVAMHSLSRSLLPEYIFHINNNVQPASFHVLVLDGVLVYAHNLFMHIMMVILGSYKPENNSEDRFMYVENVPGLVLT